MNRDILSMTLEEMTDAFSEMGIQKFRAKQVYEWLHRHLACSYDEMLNLPKLLRDELSEKFPLYNCEIARKQVSKIDNTVKYLFKLHDGDFVESVVMKYKYGYTICVSSQVGCKMGCAFCASTLGGFKRSLLPGEILSQLYRAQKDLGERISHIVLMGMGEPLDNFENVMRFLALITDEKGLNISMRNISLSTCGIVPKIEELLKRKMQLTLSISLHAPTDELRSRIMPINKKYDVDELLASCKKYAAETSRRISFEYAMLAGVNDSDDCAKILASKLRGMLCHVNLIPVNEVAESPFKPSSAERVERFVSILSKNGINATVRRKLGSDIDASCGQLRLKENQNCKKGDE
ncbi:MAG: 23S rRNA (adenine(2503)-C(2))-methyltransferase RlmN [Ruminococcaceae bacterium]|nr:23S rRNA (adenine(2503)-C(2))-methyltransferase RlmN [Oscillospiraceae bacterium]